MMISFESEFAQVGALLEQICAGRIFHHGIALASHARNTGRILLRWGATSDVVMAGLCHGLYGAVVRPDEVGRNSVASWIGANAENIAFAIAGTPRRTLERQIMASAWYRDGYQPQTLLLGCALTEIATVLVANDIALLGHTALSMRHLEETRRLAVDALRFLPPAARLDVTKLYRISDGETLLTQPSVRVAYDRDYDLHDRIRARESDDVRALELLRAALPCNSLVLDAGCGGADPIGRKIVNWSRLVGLDCSIGQLSIATQRLGALSPVCGDIMALPFGDGTFNGLCCYYTLEHIPRCRHSFAMAEMNRVLKLGGFALLTVGTADSPGRFEYDFLNEPVWFSHYDAEENLLLLKEEGFDLVRTVTVGEQSSSRLIVLARKLESNHATANWIGPGRDRVSVERSVFGDCETAQNAIRKVYRDQSPMLVAETGQRLSFVLGDNLATRPLRDKFLEQQLAKHFGISVLEASGFHRRESVYGGGVFMFSLQHTWALVAFAEWFEMRKAGVQPIPTILHIDAHDDLNAPSVLVTASPHVFSAPIGTAEMDLSVAATVPEFVERGLIGIGGFLTPFFHALADFHFVCLYPPTVLNADRNFHGLEIATETVHTFAGAGERPVVRKRTSVTQPLTSATFTNSTERIKNLPGTGPVLLDIDMDFFCNCLDDSLQAAPAPVPDRSKILQQIGLLEEYLTMSLAQRQVDVVTLALSPGFYPSILWDETVPRVKAMAQSLLQRGNR